MSTQDLPPIESRDVASTTCAASRLVASGVATTALAGALWAALGGTGCSACHEAHAALPGIPVAWLGVAFYTLLALTAGWSGFSRITRLGFLAAGGVHLALLNFLVWHHIFCGACVLTGSAAFAGGLISLMIPPRPRGWASAPFAAAVLATIIGVVALHPTQAAHVVSLPQPPLPSTQASATPSAATQPDDVKLYVYEREGCGHCLTFEEVVLPEVEKELGHKLNIERLDPDIDQETPTIIVQGKGQKEFVGVPEAGELVDAIRALE